jgi:hypothetical protein
MSTSIAGNNVVGLQPSPAKKEFEQWSNVCTVDNPLPPPKYLRDHHSR